MDIFSALVAVAFSVYMPIHFNRQSAVKISRENVAYVSFGSAFVSLMIFSIDRSLSTAVASSLLSSVVIFHLYRKHIPIRPEDPPVRDGVSKGSEKTPD